MMTIYNVNLGIGWASSGVEYAQLYRVKALREIGEVSKFIFLDFINNENIQSLTDNLGFFDEEVIWLYQYFTNVKIAPASMSTENILEKLEIKISKVINDDKVNRVYFNDKYYLNLYLYKNKKVQNVEYIYNGNLIKREYYSYTHTLTEYFFAKDNKAICYMREFYNEDGSTEYVEYIDEESNMYVFSNLIFYSKHELIEYFFKSLNLSEKDIILLDRSKDFGQVILENKGKAKLGVVIHAEHFNKNLTNKHNILWNNYYEYVFNNTKNIDFFITATKIQNDVLSNQFYKYYQLYPIIYTIPVGNLNNLVHSYNRKPYSIISASRLASEKHIDWLLKAVVEAKKTIKNLTFDIYGEGGQRQKLEELISINNANDYIRILGHAKLDEVYKNYELFLSGSTSEGFGLSLMEAIGSGLGIIGFNVNYGNPTFIRDGKNGYLIDYNAIRNNENEIVRKFSEKIIKYFNENISDFQETSYTIANKFTRSAISQKWKNIIEEVLND